MRALQKPSGFLYPNLHLLGSICLGNQIFMYNLYNHSSSTKLASDKYNHITDLELISRISRNDSSAFDELYDRYWKKLYLFGFKIFRDDEVCRDIVQEVFLDIWRRRDELKIQHVASYMHQMTKYQLAKHIRRTKIKKSYLDIMNEVRFVHHVLEEVEYKELNSYLSQTMSELPDKCRAIFYMSRFENLSNKEIGIKMNISVSTVEKHIHKALKYLRRSLHDFH